MSELPIITGYKIEEKLGQGGMADVYLGIQENLERKVAIKILIPELFRDGNFAKRFLKEARTAGQLIHPGIVTIHDVGQYEKNYYIVMEYLPSTLKDMISDGGMDSDEALEIIGKVASALDYAHSKGFIHRDIKPDNIMFREDGTPVLVDFGIARAVGSTTKLTKTGMSIGTPHYMSPEQSRGKPLDGRSDIYSLGVVLFEMLTGKTPYEAEDSDSIAIAIKHIQEAIPEIRSEVSGQGYSDSQIEYLQNLINMMMAKNPDERPQTGQEVIELASASGDDQVKSKKEKVKSEEPKDVRMEESGEKQNSAISHQPSAKEEKHEEGDRRQDPGELPPAFNNKPLNINDKLSVPENQNCEISNQNEKNSKLKSEEGKNKKALYLSLLLISVVIFTIWFTIDLTNKQEEKEVWKQALRQDSKYYYNRYIQEYPSGKFLSQAISNKERLENERIRKLREESEVSLKRERAKSAKAQSELNRLKRAEEQRKEQERLAAARRRQSSYTKPTSSYSSSSSSYSGSSYSPRVTLRSSYRKLPINDMISMLKRRNLFCTCWNAKGNFRNDFRSKIISGDRVVVDRATGLMWHQKGSSNSLKFSEAKSWIRNLNRRGYAGHSDWRLPSLEEAASLLYSKKSNGVFINPVFSKRAWLIHSGDYFDSKELWAVDFSNGHVVALEFSYSYGSFIRPVRRDR